jgi:HEAT repeat protein
MVSEKDVGPAYKPRYVAHALAVYVMGPGKQKERAAVTEALVGRLGAADRPKGLRAFFVRTLQQCGDASHVAALAPLLTDEELADPAAQAMVTLGGDAAALLAKALPGATGRGRLAIIQALGGLRDASAVEALLKAAEDADENVRLTAVWALARGGDARAVDAVVKATEATETWPRRQATRAAFALAEGLAAAGKKEDAAKVFRHLRETRTADHERHVKEAAERAWEGMK